MDKLSIVSKHLLILAKLCLCLIFTTYAFADNASKNDSIDKIDTTDRKTNGRIVLAKQVDRHSHNTQDSHTHSHIAEKVGYSRSVRRYTIPDAMLTQLSGENISLKDVLRRVMVH